MRQVLPGPRPGRFVGRRPRAAQPLPALLLARGADGADYLSVSQGSYGSATRIFPEGENDLGQDAAAIGKQVAIPVMCPNFQSPDKVAEALSNGSVDLVALCRALLADPLWPREVKEGRPEEIRLCKRCYHCIQTGVVEHVQARCLVNPNLGFERFEPECFPRPASD
jgi:2,4-dienoyl-CoA reductase-like NADH-dependent reductase (Old Yellow Enzyme family)